MASSGQLHIADQRLSQAETSETLFIQDAVVGQDTAELLQNLFQLNYVDGEAPIPPTQKNDTAANNSVDSAKRRASNVRRVLMILPLLTIPTAIAMAPRIEIYNLLVCSVHRPEILNFSYGGEISSMQGLFNSAPHSVNPSITTAPSFQIQLDRRTSRNVTFMDASMSAEKRCASDPVVRVAVAKLTTAIMVTTGILNCLTTGWWGSFSDRHGRKFVIILASCSLLITDFTYILATWLLKHVPGGYWFLLIGAVGDGLFGGLTVAFLTNQSYIADNTDEDDRSAAFSLALGIIYSGLAFGPTIGSLLIHFSGNILSVFYLGAVLHVLYAFSMFFFIPESLSPEELEESYIKYSELALSGEAGNRDGRRLYSYLYAKSQGLFVFLSPLAVFLPVRDVKKPRRDWSLTTMIVGYALSVSVGGSYTYKYQYARSTFNWSSETLGYWLSAIGAVRAIHLTVVLPVMINFFKPKPIVPEQLSIADGHVSSLPQEHDEDLVDLSDSETPLLRNLPRSESHSSYFDLKIAKYSLIIEFLFFVGMALASHAPLFATSGILGSFSVGYSPAAEAAILTLYLHQGGKETGKLFGALGLVQAICSQVVGPTVFGFIYMKTVGNYPRTLFISTTTTVILSVVFTNLVRLPKQGRNLRGPAGDVEEQNIDI